MVGMLNMLLEPLSAGVVGAGVSYMMERDTRFTDMQTLLKYGAVVAGCQFVGKRLTDMLLPEFHNAQLRSMQRISLGAVSCASLNIVAQRYISKDLRIENSLAAGGAGGAIAPLVSSMW